MTQKAKKISDKELILRIKTNSDQKAYAILLNRYKNSLMFTVLKMINNRDDAEDITMQAFTKAFKNLESYNDQYAFSTWLFKIASNASIDFLRKRKLKTTSLDNTLNNEDSNSTTFSQNILDPELDPEEKYVLKQRNRLMQEVVESMNPKYKDLIKMRFFEELKYEEIAERLNIPLGTVKVRLSRAKGLLTQILQEHKDKF
ncbi:MAG: RNA polymerase sigma factor [Chitinophagales bacterium]